MRTLRACLTLIIAALAPLTATQAGGPTGNPKTQKVTFKLVREGPFNMGLDRAIELVQVPAGTITRKGTDGKDHEQAIKPIWIAKYETRWDEYNAFWMGLDLDEETYRKGEWRESRPSRPYMSPFGGDGIAGYPADSVHFKAARKYCAWLSTVTGKKFRLPTEAEWEYACRCGGAPIPPMGEKQLDVVAWYAGNSDDKPHPVGKKRPNAWGLYDMLGNVGEYVIRDPRDDQGLLAGGSYADQAKNVHSGAREPYSPDWQKDDPQIPKDQGWIADYGGPHHIGFRVVMEE